jgi:hypothetical protein
MDWDRAWLQDTLASRAMLAWRGVEAQHVVSTMRLVDTPAEQDLLEQLLEQSKPALPPTATGHYLLTTPFRYSPVHSSRFRTADTKGQWYGAESVVAACAEVAYWRRRFILDSVSLLSKDLLTEHTFFQGAIDGRAIDLMASPWNLAREMWTHDSDYTATHALATAAQAQGVQWLAYESVRAPGARCAVVFDPASLSEPAGGLDKTMQTWHCKANRDSVRFTNGRATHQWDF